MPLKNARSSAGESLKHENLVELTTRQILNNRKAKLGQRSPVFVIMVRIAELVSVMLFAFINQSSFSWINQRVARI